MGGVDVTFCSCQIHRTFGESFTSSCSHRNYRKMLAILNFSSKPYLPFLQPVWIVWHQTAGPWLAALFLNVRAVARARSPEFVLRTIGQIAPYIYPDHVAFYVEPAVTCIRPNRAGSAGISKLAWTIESVHWYGAMILDCRPWFVTQKILPPSPSFFPYLLRPHFR